MKRNTHRENQIRSVYQSDLRLLKKNKKVNTQPDEEYEQFGSQGKGLQDPSFFDKSKGRFKLDTRPDRISMAEKERQS